MMARKNKKFKNELRLSDFNENVWDIGRMTANLADMLWQSRKLFYPI